jgi:hypothetical protein
MIAITLVAVADVTIALVFEGDRGASSPVSVANAFMEARDNLDAEAAQALFGPGISIISDGFIEKVGQYPLYFDWLRASDWRWNVGVCAEKSTGEGGTLVHCDYVSENDWTRALSHAPVSGFIEILVSDGDITGLIHSGEIEQFDDVWDTVTEWIALNHPEAVDQVLSPGLRRPILDANSVALWEQYTEEFAASQTQD